MPERTENLDIAPERADAAVAPLSSLSAVVWVAWFSLREMARRRRLISLGLLNLLPVLAVLAIRIWFSDEGVTAHQQLIGLSHRVIIPFLMPVVAMAVGVSAIGEMVEEGTIVYPWTRPIKRRAIYLGRVLAAQGVATGLLSLSLVLCFLVMVVGDFQVINWEFLKLYAQTLFIILIGACSYAALFAALGTHFRKPVLPAILFAFGWEKLVSSIPARIQELSLQYHLQNLVDKPAVAADDLTGLVGALLSAVVNREPVPRLQSVAVLLGVMVVVTLLGIYLLRQKELEN